MQNKIKKIEIFPYDPAWPNTYELEAKKIKECLDAHCLEVHHIGSTSVPGLHAKRDIDILCIVDSLKSSLKLEEIGYTAKGEVNTPLRYYFSKNTEESKVNLHVCESGHGFIELNLCFRDYLRRHSDAKKQYQELKLDLLKDASAFERRQKGLPNYTLRKNTFIKKVLREAGYAGTMINFCMHDAEWDAAKEMRQKYFFDSCGIKDPFTWTFDHPDHFHLAYYKGADVIGYAHIQKWPNGQSIMRIIVIEEESRKKGRSGELLKVCLKWLKDQGDSVLYVESPQKALGFYLHHGFNHMTFVDPKGLRRDEAGTQIGITL